MNSIERVKLLCKERNIPISKLEKDLGYSNGYIGNLRKGTFPADRLKDISEYLGTSIEFLITGIDPNTEDYHFTPETRDIAQAIYENQELHILFNAARDCSPEDILTVYTMLLALKKKEHGNINKK